MDEQRSYLERSRQVRETFFRYALGDLLHQAFSADEILAMPDDGIDDFLYGVRDRVGAVEPAWRAAMEELRTTPSKRLRGDLAKAFETIRAIAQRVATMQATAMYQPKVRIYLPHPASDRDGKPRLMLDGRLADALVWAALRLFSEVPRFLIRTCALKGCPRVYVAVKHQKFCGHHQKEAQRQALQRFRAKQKKGRKP
jgi:hypothetical protein